jgi:nicotinamidase-related amidase
MARREKIMDDWKMNGKPVLLILHMQNGFASHYQELFTNSGVIRNQQALLQAFRSKSLPVIYVNVMPNPPIAGKLPAYGFIWEQTSGTTTTPKDMEVIPELAPQPGEPVLINWPTGAFNNSGLDRALRLCGAETLVAAGFSTNGVVYSLMQGAADLYYSTILPRDASASASIKAHEVFMDLIAPALSLVTTTEDVIAHL